MDRSTPGSDPIKKQAFSNLSFNELLEKTNGHRISQLKWIENTDYKGQGEEAEKICKKLNGLH